MQPGATPGSIQAQEQLVRVLFLCAGALCADVAVRRLLSLHRRPPLVGRVLMPWVSTCVPCSRGLRKRLRTPHLQPVVFVQWYFFQGPMSCVQSTKTQP